MDDAPNKYSGLTDLEAEDMLKKLSKHYGEPVRPVSRYCAAIRQWFEAIVNNNEDPAMRETFDFTDIARTPKTRVARPEDQHGHAYYKELGHISTDISKSYLLARLIYEDEPLRTEKCPVHKGHWEGQTQLIRGCVYGCDGSGWLKTPELVVKTLERFRKHSGMTDEEVITKAKAGDLPKRSGDDNESYFAYYNKRYIFEWLYHLGQIELVPENERG